MSRAANAPASYMPPITPPPARTSARLAGGGVRPRDSFWRSDLSTPGLTASAALPPVRSRAGAHGRRRSCCGESCRRRTRTPSSPCPRCRTSWSSAPLESRGALLEEGAHALAVVLRAHGIGLPEGLAFQGGGEVDGRRAVKERLREGGGDGRARGDRAGEGPRGALELRRGHHAIHESDAEGLRGVDDLAGEHHFLGLGKADQALEQPGAAAIGHEADLDEDLTELGPVGG